MQNVQNLVLSRNLSDKNRFLWKNASKVIISFLVAREVSMSNMRKAKPAPQSSQFIEKEEEANKFMLVGKVAWKLQHNSRKNFLSLIFIIAIILVTIFII